MDCAAVATLLQEHLDHELAGDVAARVTEHLDACRQCGLEATTYQAIKDAVGRSQMPDPEALDRLKSFADDLTGAGS
ncbi:MAG: zf-HC2 domain-containing protein [Acidimicrobiia bacterium]|nr:zf-HC2 domain-containing protein [Acidimicrobiia bacterium]